MLHYINEKGFFLLRVKWDFVTTMTHHYLFKSQQLFEAFAFQGYCCPGIESPNTVYEIYENNKFWKTMIENLLQTITKLTIISPLFMIKCFFFFFFTLHWLYFHLLSIFPPKNPSFGFRYSTCKYNFYNTVSYLILLSFASIWMYVRPFEHNFLYFETIRIWIWPCTKAFD